jgi:hypothetical protein
MAPGPLCAGIVQQSLADVLPDHLRSIQAGRIGLLDFDDPQTAATGHPQNVALNLGQPRLTGLQTA